MKAVGSLPARAPAAVTLGEELRDGRGVVAEGPALDDLAVPDVVDLGDAVVEGPAAACGRRVDEDDDMLVVARRCRADCAVMT